MDRQPPVEGPARRLKRLSIMAVAVRIRNRQALMTAWKKGLLHGCRPKISDLEV
jgi:hypothetical protein